MDLAAHISKLVNERMRAINARKETLIVCAMVDMHPALRWIEWQLDGGDVAHILVSGGKGLGGRVVAGFRVEAPKVDYGADELFL